MGDEREGLRIWKCETCNELEGLLRDSEGRVGRLTQELQDEREAVGRWIDSNAVKVRRITELEAREQELKQRIAAAKAEWPITRDALLALDKEGASLQAAIEMVDEMKERGAALSTSKEET